MGVPMYMCIPRQNLLWVLGGQGCRAFFKYVKTNSKNLMRNRICT